MQQLKNQKYNDSMKEIVEIVTVGRVNGRENSLKSTIPKKIVNEVDFKKGDQIIRKYKENDDGEYTLTVKKLDL